MRKTIFSGVVARNWRRNLAAAAERYDNTTRTLKFPLELTEEPDWTAISMLHQTVAMDAPGSLIAFVYALLTAGFRIFSKSAQTNSYRNQAVLDDASWREVVCAQSELTLARNTFVPSMIYQRLLVTPRSVGGKDTAFRDTTIAIEYAKFFCKGKHSENLPEPERKLFDEIGRVLADGFKAWGDIGDDPIRAADVISTALVNLGYSLPVKSLSDRIGGIQTLVPDGGTVAFDINSSPIENAEGVVPNLIVARALETLRKEGVEAKTDLTNGAKMYFSGDANHGGLAWLFAKGLTYFRSNDVDTVLLNFGIPVERRDHVLKVIASAQAVPDVKKSFLGGVSYSDYRSGIGGTLGSWITNYCKRLFSLEEVLADTELTPLNIPTELLADEKLFEEIGITPAEINHLANQAIDQRAAVSISLDRLLGKIGGATADDVTVIETYNTLLDTLSGLLSALKERVAKEVSIANATGDKTAEKILKAYEFATPKWIKGMEKLNRLNLKPIDPGTELAKATAEFEQLHESMHRHFDLIVDWAKGTGETLSPIARLSVREKFQDSKRNATEYALRTCLDMIGRSARKCSQATLEKVATFFRQENIFADPSDLNRYFFNRKGMLYKSPFDKNPRQPYAITLQSVKRAEEILDRYSTLLSELRRETMAEPSLQLRRMTDLYRLERANFAMRMNGLPEMLPVSLALLDDVKPIFNLPIPIQLRLLGAEVSSPVMRKIFNHYYVRLESLVSVLLRDGFFLRAKLQRAGKNELLYSPASAKLWNAPERSYAPEAPFGTVMRSLSEAFGGIKPIDVREAAKYLTDTRNLDDKDVRAYFRQAPHAWYLPWPGKAKTEGLLHSKTGFAKRLNAVPSARMIGSSAYKGALDRMLANPDDVEVGDFSFLVEHHISQTVTRDTNGHFQVTLKPISTTVTAALPVKEAAKEKSALTLDKYVGIDLGERGFGYALFDAVTHKKLEQGRVRVRSMTALVKDDNIGKRKTSEKLRFGAAFDPAEVRRRENVVGDFCNAINRLCWFYGAFPVFEYSPGGASKAVDKIYQMVTERYLYSSTPTVDTARTNYWMGASYWKHPFLKQYKFDKSTGKKGKTIEALSLFPGVGVSAYGTSQTCSCCNRNPIEAVMRARSGADKKDVTFFIEQGGIVKFDDGVVIVHYSAPVSERAKYRSRNERVPLSHPAEPAAIKGDDLIRLIRRNQRQAPTRKNVKDTSISQFHCVYKDCGAVIHAEENASINIGVRFSSGLPTTA